MYVMISLKKPQHGTLTDEEQALNRQLARLRISVEHAIRGIKVSRIAAETLRTITPAFPELAFEVASGLFNLKNVWRSYATPLSN